MRSERGSAMVTSLLAVAVLAILAATIYRVTRTLVRETTWQMRSAQAQAIAEAGLEDALLQLYKDPSWTAGFVKKPFAEGSYTVTVTGPNPPTVSVTGYSKPMFIFGPAVRSVSAKALPRAGGGGLTPFLGTGSQIKVDGVIDTYDSSVNPSPASFGTGSLIWTNGQVVTKEGVGIRIRGDVVYLSGAGPKASTVEGSITKGTVQTVIPNVDGTPYASANDNLTGLAPQTYYIASKKELNVPAGKTATLQPGRYYFNKMTVAGTLTAQPGTGTVEVYLAGNMDLTGAFLNSSGIPSRLRIYGQGNITIQMTSASPFHGVITGVQTTINSDQETFGAIRAQTVNINSSGRMHLDTAVGEALAGGYTWGRGTWATGYDRP